MKLLQIAKKISVLIYGYGTEGQSAKKFLQQKIPHLHFSVLDEGKNLHPKKDIHSFDLIIRSPGVAKEKLAKISRQKITTPTEIFFANVPPSSRSKIIGITGSKGKSTTATFLRDLLLNAQKKVALAGNIGSPLLNHFDNLQSLDFLICELSSFQLEDLKFSPAIAIFTSYFEEHLERHHTEQNYRLAKANIFEHQRKDDLLVLPSKYNFFLKNFTPKSTVILSKKFSRKFFPSSSVFSSSHSLSNLGTLLPLVIFLKLKNSEALLSQTAKNFCGLPHRTQFIATVNTIKFYNDSASTNPFSSLAAAKLFQNKTGGIVLDGVNETANYTELLTFIKNQTSLFLVLPKSKIREKILATAKNLNFTESRIIIATNYPNMIKKCLAHFPPHSICVLSPGGKSFDKFTSYRERGTVFTNCVLSCQKN